jgi:hypothetical protein
MYAGLPNAANPSPIRDSTLSSLLVVVVNLRFSQW